MFQRIGLDRLAASGALALCCVANPVTAGTAIMQPVKDNTLFEDEAGSLSDGAGRYLFSGWTADARIRRAVLRFDVASVIPAGATVTSAKLILEMNKAFPGDVSAPIDVHKLSVDWGESTSDAPGEEGMGTLAERGDATWLHTFYNTAFWNSAGGDFAAAASASTVVGPVLGPYTWADAGLAADVQSWVDAPATNFGWILIGDEATFGSAKRFASREDPFVPSRPRLVVEFTAAGAGSARVPERTADGVPLRLGKLPGGDLQLSWGTSCLPSDIDYAVYEGAVGSFASHLPVLCSTGGNTSVTVTPSQNRGYFLVVPAGGGVEGSYGHESGGAERPLGFAACRAQVVVPCP